MNFYILLTTIFMAVSTVYNSKPDLSLNTYELSEIEGITMKVTNVDNTSITLEITNNSEGSLTYGHLFSLEVKSGKTWHELPLIRDDIVFALDGFGLDPGSVSQWNAYYADLYGALPSGNYRIIKEVSVGNGAGNYKQYYLGTEFIIE